MRSRDPAGADQGVHIPSDALGHSVKRRQMTPEQFLRQVTDFVRSAEIPKDSQTSWPATNIIKKDQRASPFKDLLQKISPRSSPARGGSPSMKTHSVPSPSDYEYPVVKSSGKSYLLDKPSSLSPDPFQSRVAEEPP